MKFFVDYILEVLIILPLFSSFCLLFIKEENSILIKIFSLWMSCLIFCISVLLWIFFDARVVLQYVSYYDILPMFYTKYMIGIDGLSIFFILLTALLVPLCCLCSWDSIKQRVRDFFICLFMVEFCVFNVFVSMDLLYFYIFFELLMIPMFIMILGWGSRVRRVHAAYYFFFYTLFGSFFMLSAIIYIYQEIGSTNIFVLLDTEFTFLEQLCLWMALFISLIIKIPLVPVHIWLPEAHVESPTTGSVLLAGILLKMGPYGLWRFVLPVYTEASQYFIDFTMCLGIITILLGSLATIRQVDIKKMIAYSSVGHMGVVYIGLILDDKIAFVGNVYLMIAHGITSSGLFLCAGCLYDRYHTRLISYYAGVQESMPVLANFFFFFCCS